MVKAQNMPEVSAGTDFLSCEFNLECLDWHNTYREAHGAPPLALDAQLCASAQYWANILAHRDEYHAQNPLDVGENLFEWPVVPELVRAHDLQGKDVAAWWYKTQKNYYFTKDPKVQHIYGGTYYVRACNAENSLAVVVLFVRIFQFYNRM